VADVSAAANGPNTTLTVTLADGTLIYTLAGDLTAYAFNVIHSGADTDITTAPSISTPGLLSVPIGVPSPVRGIVISDSAALSTQQGQTAADVAGTLTVATAAAANAIFTVTVESTQGLLMAVGPGVSGSGTTKLTIIGTLVQVNNALATFQSRQPGAELACERVG
jgi:hypothetical protein